MNEQLDRIEIQLAALEGKIDQAYQSSEKVRKYLLWGFWITAGALLLPLLILPLLLPAFLGSVALPAGF
jgi:hypothetical protein